MEDKWSDARFRKKHGLGPWDLRADGVVRRFGGKMLVMANGPKHATTYRLYKAKGEMAGFSVPGVPDLMENRIGMQEIETVETETKGKKGKKSKPNFKYGPEHARGIQGVAWVVSESILRDFPNYFPRPVDLVKPKTKPSDFPIIKYDDEGNGIRMKIVDSVIKIRWEIDGRSVSSWESRETARRVFGGTGAADDKIYKAAEVQESDFEDWLHNPESGRDGSETPWRSGVEPTPERELTPGLMSDRGGTPASLARSSRARTPGPKVTIQEPNMGGKTATLSRDVWIKDFLDFKGIKDPATMSPQQNADMMQAWRLDSAAMAVA
jgi:hypothetical protein